MENSGGSQNHIYQNNATATAQTRPNTMTENHNVINSAQPSSNPELYPNFSGFHPLFSVSDTLERSRKYKVQGKEAPL